MLSCSIWFSAPSLWMGGGVESRCVGRVYSAVGAVRHCPHCRHDLRNVNNSHRMHVNQVWTEPFVRPTQW